MTPEPGKPLSETMPDPINVAMFQLGRTLMDGYASKVYKEEAKAILDKLDQDKKTITELQAKIEHQAAQIRAYGKALEAFADGRIYGPWTEFAKDVLKQFPLSGSEEGGEGR